MKEYQIFVTSAARRQISEIAEYIQSELYAVEAGIAFVNGIEKKIQSLSIMPKRTPIYKEAKIHGEIIRRAIYKHFNIYYYVDDNSSIVWIIAVIYAKRNQKPLLKSIVFD